MTLTYPKKLTEVKIGNGKKPEKGGDPTHINGGIGCLNFTCTDGCKNTQNCSCDCFS